MLKKISVGVVFAGALSVWLSAPVWADPGNGNGAGGIPGKIGNQLNAPGPVTPGSVVSGLAKQPGTNTPTAVGAYESENFGALNVPTPPGQVVRIFTPGCKAGGSLPCL
jgi:hypothetical protein